MIAGKPKCRLPGVEFPSVSSENEKRRLRDGRNGVLFDVRLKDSEFATNRSALYGNDRDSG